MRHGDQMVVSDTVQHAGKLVEKRKDGMYAGGLEPCRTEQHWKISVHGVQRRLQKRSARVERRAMGARLQVEQRVKDGRRSRWAGTERTCEPSTTHRSAKQMRGQQRDLPPYVSLQCYAGSGTNW